MAPSARAPVAAEAASAARLDAARGTVDQTVLWWTLRTPAGRLIECTSRRTSDAIEVQVGYDGITLELQVFPAHEDTHAIMWAEEQRTAVKRAFSSGNRCQRCDVALAEIASSALSAPVTFLTGRRPHRCPTCARVTWARPQLREPAIDGPSSIRAVYKWT